MNEVYEELELFRKTIMSIHGGRTYSPTWNRIIDVFINSIQMIERLKARNDVSNDDWYVLRRLADELLSEWGVVSRTEDTRRYKLKKLYYLTQELKEELTSIPYIPDDVIEINNVNDWIKSLKIYILGRVYSRTPLLIDYYQSSDEVYRGIRKIVFTKNPPLYKKIYAYRVVEKLDSKENQMSLPKGVSLKKEDYELTQLMRLIQSHEEVFNPWKFWGNSNALLINERLATCEWENDMILFRKR